MQNNYLIVKNASFHYDLEGQGYPVILVHGFSLDMRMWQYQMPALTPRYQVLRYDLRGFGKSEYPDTRPYSHTSDLLAIMDALKIEKAHLVGFARGGSVILDMALAAPERISALVVCDAVPTGYVRQEPRSTGSITPDLAAARNMTMQALWLENPLFTSTKKNPEHRKLLEEIVGEYSGWHWRHTDPLESLSPAAAERLQEIKIPTLVMVGENDGFDFRHASDFTHERIPGSKFVEFKGMGHLTPFEAADQFNREMVDFFDSLEGIHASLTE